MKRKEYEQCITGHSIHDDQSIILEPGKAPGNDNHTVGTYDVECEGE